VVSENMPTMLQWKKRTSQAKAPTAAFTEDIFFTLETANRNKCEQRFEKLRANGLRSSRRHEPR
jgi:hypothetical protein